MANIEEEVRSKLASGGPLAKVTTDLCHHLGATLGAACVMVVLADEAGALHHLAGSSVSQPYIEALEGAAIGPGLGSCGSAIYLNQVVEVDDIAHDPRWATFRTLALPLSYRACTSSPIRDRSGRAIGALAVYLRETRKLTPNEWNYVNRVLALCEEACAARPDAVAEICLVVGDGLTGLPDRQDFEELLSRLRCELPGSWALLIVDVDNIKSINATLGREAGDAVLKAIAERLRSETGQDTVFRTGGSEFTILVQDAHGLSDIQHSVEAVLRRAGAMVDHRGELILPRVIAGGAVLSPQDTHPGIVRRNAVFALHQVRKTGEVDHLLYSQALGTRLQQRRSSIGELLAALEEGRIDAHYQPIVRLDTHQIVGMEALCRLIDENGRVLPAVLFQEAMIDARAGADLTDRMLQIVGADMRAWLDQGLELAHMALNVTAVDFYLGQLQSRIRAAFDAFKLPLDLLVLEVTEETYMGRRDDVVTAQIRELRVSGARIALDDFGTGFAALAHLLNVPVDVVKIDRSFIRNLAPNHPSLAVVKGLSQITNDLGIKLVAEGIEHPEQAQLLRSLGAPFGQGYVFSKPVDRVAASQLLRDHGENQLGARPMIPLMGDGGAGDRRGRRRPHLKIVDAKG